LNFRALYFILIIYSRRADHSRWPCTRVVRSGSRHRGYIPQVRGRRAFRGSPCCPESQRSPPRVQLENHRQLNHHIIKLYY